MTNFGAQLNAANAARARAPPQGLPHGSTASRLIGYNRLTFSLSLTLSTMYNSEHIAPGDIVSIQTNSYGKKEGLVIGTHVDWAGRQIVEVQLEPAEIFHAWYPTVTRVRRTIAYSHPSPNRQLTIERRVVW